jgi:hypothetical protein
MKTSVMEVQLHPLTSVRDGTESSASRHVQFKPGILDDSRANLDVTEKRKLYLSHPGIESLLFGRQSRGLITIRTELSRSLFLVGKSINYAETYKVRIFSLCSLSILLLSFHPSYEQIHPVPQCLQYLSDSQTSQPCKTACIISYILYYIVLYYTLYHIIETKQYKYDTWRRMYSQSVLYISLVQGIHKRMVRFQYRMLLKPHHYFVYSLYNKHSRSRWPCDLRLGLRPLDCWDRGFKSR